jgi:lipid-binding SYLF domain-containing protein
MLMIRLLLATLIVAAVWGCQTIPKTEADRSAQHANVQKTVEQMKAKDPAVNQFVESAYAYAVFPKIGSGGVVLGGAFGRGQVFCDGELVGYCKVTEGTIGAQIGGSSYSEMIFFKDKSAFDRFIKGQFAFQASASAVAVESGNGGNAAYSDGVAVFTMGYAGLKLQAAIGGQQFAFVPH